MKQTPEDIFRSCGGQLRMSEAIRFGMTRYMLYSLRDRGVIEQVSRGIYRLAELSPITNPDLVLVSLRFPHAVVCLVSALAGKQGKTGTVPIFPENRDSPHISASWIGRPAGPFVRPWTGWLPCPNVRA